MEGEPLMTQKFKRFRLYCPLPCMIMIAFAPIAAVVHILSRVSVTCSDFFLRYFSVAPRFVMAQLTNLLPFSLAETVLMASPVIVIAVAVLAFRYQKKELYHSVRLISILLSILSCAYFIFAVGFAPGYSGSTLEARMELDRKKVSASELENTARLLKAECEQILDEVEFLYGAESIMPYSLNEMNRKLNDAYAKAARKYDFILHFPSNVKFVVLSVPMSYTHITGVYTFFTGEANINIHFPDYTLPFTAAHEMSHQRGIAREDEANFMAFLVCCESDDPYIRYSGYMNLFEYVFSALYSASKDAYRTLWYELDGRMRGEINAYNEFFEPFRENVAASVSGQINNSFLQSQGQSDGTKSYGRVVDLAVAYVLYGEHE